MARKSASGLATSSEKIAVAVDTTSNTAIQGELATDPIPHIKVNNANLAEIKSSLDEAVKGVCPRFSKL
jgi:5,10-methylenetetrahydrofolate reductase